MPTTIVERYGNLSATGVAKEATFGTAVTPTSFLPMSGNTLELDPGLFFPKVMMGQRDDQIFPLYGQYKNAGSVDGPLFPTNGGAFIAASIGQDAAAGSGVTGSSPTSSTTLSSGTSAGATSFTVASATGYAVGNFVQVDVNNTVGPTTSEVRKIATIVSNTITVDVALTYAHAGGAAVSKVVAPFTHTISQQNSLPSLTVEKNVGGAESLQFSGARVSKYELKFQTSNSEVTQSIDLQAKHAAVLPTPSAITVANESPYVFAEASVSMFGQTIAHAENIDLTIDNSLKATYVTNNSHELGFLSPVGRKISGKMDLVFTSFDDATWGYWTQMQNGATGAFSVGLAHPGNGGSWTFSLNKIAIDTYSDAIKEGDIVSTTVAFQAMLDLTTLNTITATAVNSQYLPF